VRLLEEDELVEYVCLLPVQLAIKRISTITNAAIPPNEIRLPISVPLSLFDAA
jgi:hypothetical protein